MKPSRSRGPRVLFALVAPAAVAAAAGIVMGFSGAWMGTALPLGIATALLAYELVTAAAVRSAIGYLDIREFRGHRHVPLDALEAVFSAHEAAGGSSLPVALRGTMEGKAVREGPLSGDGCLAWRLRVDTGVRRRGPVLLAEEPPAGMILRDGEAETRVVGAPILNLRKPVTAELAWGKLPAKGEALGRAAGEAAARENVSLPADRTVRVEEQALKSGLECTVYGICRRDAEGILVTGTGAVDDPGSLYVTDVDPAARTAQVRSLRRRNLVRRLVTAPLAAFFLLVGGNGASGNLLAELPVFNPHREGEIRYRNAAADRRVFLEGVPMLETRGTWEFSGGDDRSFTRLLDNDLPLIVSETGTVEIVDVKEESRVYLPGTGGAVTWNGAFWYVGLGDALPEDPPPPVQSGGRIFIRNETPRSVVVVFRRRESGDTDSITWTWKPWEGMDWQYGTYASTTTDPKTSRPVTLATGDSVLMRVDNRPVRHLLLGTSKDAVWMPDKAGWFIRLTEESLASRTRQVFVKNPSRSTWRMEIMNQDGTKKTTGFWEFDPGDGVKMVDGTSITETMDGKTADFLLSESDSVRLTRRYEAPVWKGRLADCPYASFRRGAREWRIEVP